MLTSAPCRGASLRAGRSTASLVSLPGSPLPSPRAAPLTGAGGVDRPDYLGGLEITSDIWNSPNKQYFNKSAFSSEPLGQMGNANQRFFHGPGLNNWDLGVEKMTRVHESMSVQFRAEFFNAFNHAQFNSPQGNFTSGTFGRITSAKPRRIGQMSLKFLW